MEWKIPYFEYDLFARIAPGALTIAVAQYAYSAFFGAAMPVPHYWKALLPMWRDVVPDTATVLFGGLTLLGASYVIGLLYEGLFPWLWRRLPHAALVREAKRRKTWRRHVPDSTPAFPCDEKELSKFLIQWLVCTRDADVRSAFVHMHRFQAEARLCAYSVLPLLVLAVAAAIKGKPWESSSPFVNWWPYLVILLLAILCMCCTLSRERRRWVQGLAILDALRSNDDTDTAAQLQKALQNLCQYTPKAVRWRCGVRIPLRPKGHAVLIKVVLTRNLKKE